MVFRFARVDQRGRQQFEVAFHNAPTGLALINSEGVVLQANPALSRLLLVPSSTDLVGQVLADVVPPDATTIASAVESATESIGTRVELHVSDEHGEHWLVASFVPLSEAELGRPLDTRSAETAAADARVLVQIEEITQQRATERSLVEKTMRDALTGLGNRLLLFQYLDHAMQTGTVSSSTLAIVDLDRFKWVNDTLGHHAGDAVLVEVAHRLRALVRPDDLVTRVGGDEFVVVLRNLDRREDAVEVAERIAVTLRTPIHIDGHDVTVHGSVGVSLPGSSTDDPHALLADADTAMYRAKEAGGNRVEVFSRPMRRARERHLKMDSALRKALEDGGLQLWYQPIVNLRTGAFDGVEALLRWPGHDAEIEDAISVAEESELIVTLGEWVLSHALRDNPGGILGINVSVRQLIRPQFTEVLLRALDEAGIEPGQLCVEVTETSLAENIEVVVTALRELRKTGIRVAIDDFGTGHASLTYLAKFPVDVVKVDRSFVHGLGNDPASGVIVRSVAAMAHALGMTVIAEGVENLHQLEIVLEAGCDAAQGYLFSRPVPRQQCTETLANAVPWPVGFSDRRATAAGRSSTPTIEPARRYRLLLDLARDITGRLDLDEVLAASFVALRQLLSFAGGSIQLIDDENQSVRLAAADPPATEEAYQTRIPIGQGIGGRIVVSGEPRYIPDLTLEPDVPTSRATSSGVRSYFGVPLITEGAAIGVLQIDSPEVDPWTDEDRFTVLAFTPIVAAAIQNARLFEREAAAAMGLPRPRTPLGDPVRNTEGAAE
jgi:diguanylate cyclase (GGDEF)-like protein